MKGKGPPWLRGAAALILVLLLSEGAVASDVPRGPERMEGVVTMNAVSLQFIGYRNDPEELARRVDGLLAGAPAAAGGEGPVALVSPHAGYQYSGPVAAYAYRAVEGRSYDTVVVIGPSHRVPFRGLSVLNADSFETPLGRIPTDREMIDDLIGADGGIDYIPEAHGNEHSLEVQVPFLQRALKDFRIVLAVAGSPDRKADEAFVNRLTGWAEKKKVLIVASSDFSHYYSYDRANIMDHMALDSVVAMEGEDLESKVRSKTCELCGIRPVLLTMEAAERLGVKRGRLLTYANSGDTAGPKSEVVGYAAVAFYREGGGEGEGSGEGRLDRASKGELLAIARRAIEGVVRDGNPPEPETGTEGLREPRGAFVTIKVDGKLRGCIGNFGIRDPRPLYRTVSDMAVAAATQDPRFPPLRTGELDKIDIEISALSPLRAVESTDEIEVGRHGIYISQDYRSGVLLPQVATEYGWDRETFLQQTCRKAGLPSDAWKGGEAQISVFEAEVFGEKEN